ncbi:MAG: ATP-binding protein [Nitrospiraceae bacterium]
MVNHSSTKVAILGGGKGGTVLLDLLSQVPDLEIVGIADKDLTAPAIKRARDLNIKVTDQVTDLIGDHGVNLLVDVTGDPEMERFIAAHKGPGVEVLGGAAAKLLWNLVQYESNLQAQLFHIDKLAGIGSFVAGIAHDINNPLQLVLGFAEGILDEQDPAIIREYATEIIQAVKRTSAICTGLTQYTRRITADEFVEVDLNRKLEEALKIARHATIFQDLSVVKEYAPKAVIRARPEELLHALVNLIANAIQAMEGRGTLMLVTRCEASSISVTISDTGCGIPKDHLEKIFEAFFTTKPPGKGTGLGLYNVKAVVEQHFGKLSVDSEVGRGTTFRLQFPQPEQPTQRP